MKVLILGSKGMLGSELMETFPDSIGWDIDEIDITDRYQVIEKIFLLKPELMINAAAYTNVDGAESHLETAMAVNAEAVGYLAEAANKCDASIVHISTDYVFDGEKKQGYNEKEEPNPISAYGRSKAEGEKLLMQTTKKYYLVRTAWMYGKHGNNFVKTMLRLAKEQDELKIVDDQIGCPTYAKDLVNAIKELIEQPHGIYHITNDGQCSWYGLTIEIMKLKRMKINLVPITTDQYPLPAKRPKYSILINTKTKKLRHWKKALKEYLEEVE